MISDQKIIASTNYSAMNTNERNYARGCSSLTTKQLETLDVKLQISHFLFLEKRTLIVRIAARKFLSLHDSNLCIEY
jgi:hypothetical protein